MAGARAGQGEAGVRKTVATITPRRAAHPDADRPDVGRDDLARDARKQVRYAYFAPRARADGALLGLTHRRPRRSWFQRSKQCAWNRTAATVAVKPSSMMSLRARTSPQASHGVPLPAPCHTLSIRFVGKTPAASFCWMKGRRAWSSMDSAECFSLVVPEVEASHVELDGLSD